MQKKFKCDRGKLPCYFPTHKHSAEFWEHLGRTIATYGFLEEILKKAIFALTATRRYTSNEIEAAFSAWHEKMEKALTSQLYKLAGIYEEALRSNPEVPAGNFNELIGQIKDASIIRNVLCHASWHSPSLDGKSLPFYIRRGNLLFQQAIDVDFLEQVRQEVAQLAIDVIETVTSLGWRFPGSSTPEKDVWG